MTSVVRNRLKFWQDILDTPIVYEIVKNGYREFDHSSTLKGSTQTGTSNRAICVCCLTIN